MNEIEIEITPEMIDAGVAALNADCRTSPSFVLVAEIYRAMARVSPSAPMDCTELFDGEESAEDHLSEWDDIGGQRRLIEYT